MDDREPSAAAKRIINRVLVVLILVLLTGVTINPVTHLGAERWAAWFLPMAIGVVVGVIASYRYFSASGEPPREESTSEGRATGRGTLAAIFVFAMSTFAAREWVLALGPLAAGTERALHARVVEVRGAGRVSNRCRTFATFRFESGETKEICADSRIRGSLIQGQLGENDSAELSVLANRIGSWVTAIRVPAAAAATSGVP